MASPPNVSSSPNPENSADIGASSTAPIAVDDSVTNNPVEQVEEVVPSQENLPKRQKRSAVWNDVTETEVNGKTIVKCNHCHIPLAVSKGGPTTSYKRHIDSCTVRKTKISGKGSGSTQTILNYETIGESCSLSTYKYDKEAMKDITAKMIMVHEYPFKMVEHKLFRIHNKMLNPKYEPFSRHVIRDHAMKLYALEKEKMKVMFNGVGRVSLTSDLWTSNQTKGYMCITGHFLDSEWNLQNRILNFCLLPPPHTGVAIADKIFECLSDWGLENKISTITFDNASSNDAAVRSLKEQFQGRNALYFGGKIFHVRCCAHILNLMVQDGLVPLKVAIENVRESVKFITLTPSRLYKFNEVVKNMPRPLPTDQSLILDCITRWNSTYHMLARALIFKDAFPRYAMREATYCYLPSEEDWEVARDVCKFLAIFDKITDIFSGREYTTTNLFFPEVWKIRQILDEMVDDSREFMKIMVEKMKAKFDKYWKESSLFMIIAAVLDPRNKMKLIEYVYGILYQGFEREERLDSIRKELQNLFDDYIAKENSSGDGNNSQGGGERSNTDATDKSRAEFEKWVKQFGNLQPNRKEIDIYLEESVLMGGGIEFDVLAWWKSNTLKFPVLSKMARDILSIPVTTVPSESAFSAGRRVISDDRASLGDDTVEGLLCASNWLRVEFNV